MRKIKVIWDFRGPSAVKIAEHHLIHLKEYIKINHLNIEITGSDVLHELHAITFMVIDEQDKKLIRDALKPHRGQFYEE